MNEHNKQFQIIVKKPTNEEIKTAQSWQEWSKEVSEFPWEYNWTETCLILEGEASVEPEIGDAVSFGPGDWVIFPAGMKCTWKVSKPIKKKYNFS